MKSPQVLMIDVGGSNVKMMVTGHHEMRKFSSGANLTARDMVERVKEAITDWSYDCVTLGFPGLVADGRIVRKPLNLGGGWLRFDFGRHFGKPVQIINDSALQAVANYKKGRMLFVGLGTSVGASLVADGVVVPIELGLIPLGKRHTFMSRLSKKARKERGHERWEATVHSAVELLADIFWPQDMVIGGGNAKHLKTLPQGCRRTSNFQAIKGAARLWDGADMLALSCGTTWRIETA